MHAIFQLHMHTIDAAGEVDRYFISFLKSNQYMIHHPLAYEVDKVKCLKDFPFTSVRVIMAPVLLLLEAPLSKMANNQKIRYGNFTKQPYDSNSQSLHMQQ